MTKRKWNKKAAANVTRNVTSLKGHECDLGCQLFKEGGVPGSVKGWAVAASSSAPAPPPRLLRPGSSAPAGWFGSSARFGFGGSGGSPSFPRSRAPRPHRYRPEVSRRVREVLENGEDRVLGEDPEGKTPEELGGDMGERRGGRGGTRRRRKEGEQHARDEQHARGHRKGWSLLEEGSPNREEGRPEDEPAQLD